MRAALEVRSIVKRFGAFTAVDRASFAVERGSIVGFIGPNGAGKTTTMRCCATLDLPDSGDVLVDGHSVLDEPRRARARLGFMPDSYGAYPNTTVADYLDFYARAYGLRGAARKQTIAGVVDFTALGRLLAKEMGALSKGMKQRLCLAKTLLHDPSLLILDEPAAGLDPRARVELRELLKALAGAGKAILISSHILAELGEMCDGVVVIEGGSVLAVGAVDDVVRGAVPHVSVFVRALAGPEATERALLEQPGVTGVRRARDGVVCELELGAERQAALLAALVAAGLRPVEFSVERAGLEDVFLSVTKGAVR